MNTIMQDKRQIMAVVELGVNEPFTYRIGTWEVTNIVPYEENGHMAAITWIAVERNGEIYTRFPADKAMIFYK